MVKSATFTKVYTLHMDIVNPMVMQMSDKVQRLNNMNFYCDYVIF